MLLHAVARALALTCTDVIFDNEDNDVIVITAALRRPALLCASWVYSIASFLPACQHATTLQGIVPKGRVSSTATISKVVNRGEFFPCRMLQLPSENRANSRLRSVSATVMGSSSTTSSTACVSLLSGTERRATIAFLRCDSPFARATRVVRMSIWAACSTGVIFKLSVLCCG